MAEKLTTAKQYLGLKLKKDLIIKGWSRRWGHDCTLELRIEWLEKKKEMHLWQTGTK